MATKKSSSDTKVTRISASDAGSAKKTKTTKTTKTRNEAAPKAKAAKTTQPREKRGRRSPLRAMGDYFAGAWHELREVRWPTRRATWGMTGALLGFTAFFVIVILLLDALFQWMFNALLGS